MVKLKKRLHGVFSFLLKGGFIFCVTLLLFEGAFRLYVIDFYGYATKQLNGNFERNESSDDLLIIGDSFSAFQEGYAWFLNDSLSNHNVHNISVSGTSIREQYLFGKHHLQKIDPKIMIFQFYVGNDLFGWDHPVNWSEVGVVRNIYWQVAERLWTLAYINQRLGVLRNSSKAQKGDNYLSLAFSPELYSNRNKVQYRVEPSLVENSVYLKNGRDVHLNTYLRRMQHLFAEASADSRIFLLIIPHASQVNQSYFDRTKQLGATFSEDFEVGAMNSPLIHRFQSFFHDDARVKLLNPIAFLNAQEEKGVPTYFNNDSHLNYEGQRLMGEFLLQNIMADAGID